MVKKKIIGIIPARYSSTRFPGKPLVDIFGKPMIQRVYEQAKKADSLTDVIVATDDERIEKCVLGFGGHAAMTSSSHKTGTDRCSEVVEKLYPDFDIAINIQGDEPYIHPESIDELVSCFKNKEVTLATLIKKIDSSEDIFNQNRIKVVIDKNLNALYFSRSPIPYLRSPENKEWLDCHDFYKHIGIYGYKVSELKKITSLEQSTLEIAESLEQLRWLENGYKIKTKITAYESVSIDAQEDLKKL